MKLKKVNSKDYISVRGCRVNNLKNIDVQIPHNQFIVITGVSGSGKSSLAFDTLYAEGQRRYVESLSTYARQFMGKIKKPECDFIEGIAPAVAIQQKTISSNPRSTVGTSTEIYDYLRMLYARIGRTYSPVSGQEVKKHSTDDIIRCMLAHPTPARLTVLTPLVVRNGRTLTQQLDAYYKTGYLRVEVDGTPTLITDLLTSPDTLPPASRMRLVVDRLKTSEEKATVNRLADSAQTAMYEGDGTCTLKFDDGQENTFSLRFEADGMEFQEPTDQMFSFNSPTGACPTCEGYGRITGIDENLVIPDPGLSVYDGAVACWKGEKMSEWKKEFVRWADTHDFPVFTPYNQLTQQQRDILWHGIPEKNEWGDRSICIDEFFRMLIENPYKIQYRVMLARYRGKTTCPLCHGRRLRQEAEYVKIGGKSITDLCLMPIDQLSQFFATLSLTDHERHIARRLLTEIKSRLQYLTLVGLGYLTLARLSNTLSGGESQRIHLAATLGSPLVGSLYILDEPSVGLHPRDTQRLISALRHLQEQGNTILVVEHDEDIIRSADWLIDIGPGAGHLGGQVVYSGLPTPSAPLPTSQSHTLDYLTGRAAIPIPQSRRPWNNHITLQGACANNLKNVTATFPLNVLTCVTGVSGSGKSTLVRDILYPALKRALGESAPQPGNYKTLSGDIALIHQVDLIDQRPVGASSRSNSATYIGAWDHIRRLLAEQPLAKQLRLTPAYFSFNVEGGRCPSCKGEGTVTVEMQFMNDLTLTCDTCHGQRFQNEVLEVRFHGANANDILQMTVDQAIQFFTQHNQKAIAQRLQPLHDVGLGYITLGQSTSTLSGGESQRLKLASYLGQTRTQPTFLIFDEPTTGLHTHDIHILLQALQALLQQGHTLLVVEHNMHFVKCADHIIDLGPEGGQDGGNIIATGTPEQVIATSPNTYTAQHLAQAMLQK